MKNKILIFLLITVIIILGLLIGWKFLYKKDNVNTNAEINNNTNVENVDKPQEEVKETPKINTWSGDSRSVAVVIDNVGDARPQAGLNDAAIVYEVTVEGGLTRILAIFKDIKDVSATIGPVRSARPVFLDYALENDSIFVHFGYSDRAKEEIDRLNIDNVNGLVANSTFWRTKEKKAPHNALTNMEKIQEYASKKDYRTTSTTESVLNYVTNEVNLEKGETANNIDIPYTGKYKISFKYNEEKKVYERYLNGKVQQDWVSGQTRTAKNIIITFANNYTTSEENGYGRQEIENIGDLEGYYITNGKIIKINCSKSSRSGQTVYKDKESGKEIEVNDGNTYIQIVPLKTEVTFE